MFCLDYKKENKEGRKKIKVKKYENWSFLN